MIVANPAYGSITEDWFDPGYWGECASPVATGGRGGAWFISAEQGDLVLRHYRRGGLIARVSEKSYVNTGLNRTRSFREFQLLRTLYNRGLPVPEPVAAWAGTHHGLWYHAAILTRRIEGAVPWPEVPNSGDEALWRQVGRMIRRFHDAGLDHVDLNCDNILMANGELYLIDLDRCRLRSSSGGNWQQANLNRLWRSVVKRMSTFTERQRESLWKCLVEGYHTQPLSGSGAEPGKTVL